MHASLVFWATARTGRSGAPAFITSYMLEQSGEDSLAHGALSVSVISLRGRSRRHISFHWLLGKTANSRLYTACDV